jgi:hypothetical protein
VSNFKLNRLGYVVVTALILGVVSGDVAVAGAAKRPVPRPSTYLAGPFGQKTEDRFVRDLASVGIGVYQIGAARPVRPVHGRVSPLRLTVDQARSLALGVWSHAGQSGGTLDGLAGPVRLSSKRSLRSGLVIAAWAKRARTPSAALARRILGHVHWKLYRSVVFPIAVPLLFASDVAMHLRGHARARRSVVAAAATADPCTAVQSFLTETIENVFNAIGHIRTDKAEIDRLFGKGVFADIVKGVGDILSFGANTLVDAAHQIVLGGVKIPMLAVTNAVAGVAAVVTVVGSVAAELVPWTGRIHGSPNPISKGVSAGVPGTLSLDVTAPAGNLQWPPIIAGCAGTLGITLPTLTPRDADVTWDISNQEPGELIVRKNDTGPLDANGTAKLNFETTTETPEEAQGNPMIGDVVVFAKVHRTDLDQLRDRLTQNLLAGLPTMLKDTIGPSLRAALTPLLNNATNKITSVQDLDVDKVELVRYHVPKPPTQRKPPNAKGGSVFSLLIAWPGSQGRVPPLLDIHSCSGLRGPWRGTLNSGGLTNAMVQAIRPIHFTPPAVITGSASGQIPGGVAGEVFNFNLSWNIPVRVSAGAHPTMSFPGATRHLVNILSSPGQPDLTLDSGAVKFQPIADRAFPLSTHSAACK